MLARSATIFKWALYAGATLVAAEQLMSTGKAKRPLCVFAGRRMYE